jgi:hypothetical protein
MGLIFHLNVKDILKINNSRVEINADLTVNGKVLINNPGHEGLKIQNTSKNTNWNYMRFTDNSNKDQMLIGVNYHNETT